MQIDNEDCIYILKGIVQEVSIKWISKLIYPLGCISLLVWKKERAGGGGWGGGRKEGGGRGEGLA